MTILSIWYGKTMFRFFLVILLLVSVNFDLIAQKKEREFNKTIQLSFFPGLSTNGLNTWRYYNKYSLNFFGGLSGGNRILEIGGVSNVNLFGSSGIQIAGLANIIGPNAFTNLSLSEKRQVVRDGFTASTNSIQLAGLINFVMGDVKGIQVSGGMNVSGGDFLGFQLAMMGNTVHGNSVGIQLSGLYNRSLKSTTGVQFSALYNTTKYKLVGIQSGLFNYAKTVTGKKTPGFKTSGKQFGLINASKKMAGLQIGLINYGKEVVGKQIGLINIFSGQAPKEQIKNGTPIGLLNFGALDHPFRVYVNELFQANLEFSTGNCANCSFSPSGMPYFERNKRFNQNNIIVGVNFRKSIWGFGYGFRKLLYNKYDFTGNPKNNKKMMSYGIQWLHLNSSYELERQFNLLTKVLFEYGKRFSGGHVYCGVSVNFFVHDMAEKATYVPELISFEHVNLSGYQGGFWPGYSLGIQF